MTTQYARPHDEMVRWHHMGEVQMAHRGHWFDADSMRFFKCRLPTHWSPLVGGRYFVSSEQSDYGAPRLYTIREALSNGDVATVGEFQGYGSRKAAERAARELPTDYSASLMETLASDLHNGTGWIKTSKQLARYTGAPLADCKATIAARARMRRRDARKAVTS